MNPERPTLYPRFSSKHPRLPAVPDEVRHLSLTHSTSIPFLDIGEPSGFPIIYHHGWPSSAWQAALAHRCALQMGVRIIAPDRSRFRPTRNPGSVSDIADDITSLIHELRIPKCSHLGVSGGAPYALATISKMPDKTLRGLLCSGMVIPSSECIKKIFLPYRILAFLQKRRPSLTKILLWSGFWSLRNTPETWLIRTLSLTMPGPDREALRKDGVLQLVERSIRLAIHPNPKGVISDGIRLTNPWGCLPPTSSLPVQLAHGARDRIIRTEALSLAYPDVTPDRYRIFPNEGHYSLPIRNTKELLQTLIP